MSDTQQQTTPGQWLRRSAIVAAVVIAAALLLSRCGDHGASARQAYGDGMRPVPVRAVPAAQGELPIYLDALGTVTATNSAVVRARVDGELLRVNFTEGQRVQAGALLAEIDARPYEVQLQQAEGQLARDEALLKNARVDLERYETLWQQDSISRQELDTQRSLVAQYEGAVAADRGEVANAKLQLSYTKIRAPFAGRVGLRAIDPGNLVRATDTEGLVAITQEQPIAVVFTIPETQLAAVRAQLAQAGTQLAVTALDRQRSAQIGSGHLLAVDNQIDVATGTVRLKAVFDNADGALYPNQFVNVRLHVDTLKDAVLIPANAVQRGAQGEFVYAVNADKTVKLTPVTLGVASGEQIVVEKGVAAGTPVVIDGVDRLRDGATVELIDR
jgi:multidrug efflux system membrane fusion protein